MFDTEAKTLAQLAQISGEDLGEILDELEELPPFTTPGRETILSAVRCNFALLRTSATRSLWAYDFNGRELRRDPMGHVRSGFHPTGMRAVGHPISLA